MGVTDELFIGHARKRLLVLSRLSDDPQVALDRVRRGGVRPYPGARRPDQKSDQSCATARLP